MEQTETPSLTTYSQATATQTAPFVLSPALLALLAIYRDDTGRFNYTLCADAGRTGLWCERPCEQRCHRGSSNTTCPFGGSGSGLCECEDGWRGVLCEIGVADVAVRHAEITLRNKEVGNMPQGPRLGAFFGVTFGCLAVGLLASAIVAWRMTDEELEKETASTDDESSSHSAAASAMQLRGSDAFKVSIGIEPVSPEVSPGKAANNVRAVQSLEASGGSSGSGGGGSASGSCLSTGGRGGGGGNVRFSGERTQRSMWNRPRVISHSGFLRYKPGANCDNPKKSVPGQATQTELREYAAWTAGLAGLQEDEVYAALTCPTRAVLEAAAAAAKVPGKDKVTCDESSGTEGDSSGSGENASRERSF